MFLLTQGVMYAAILTFLVEHMQLYADRNLFDFMHLWCSMQRVLSNMLLGLYIFCYMYDILSYEYSSRHTFVSSFVLFRFVFLHFIAALLRNFEF